MGGEVGHVDGRLGHRGVVPVEDGEPVRPHQHLVGVEVAVDRPPAPATRGDPRRTGQLQARRAGAASPRADAASRSTRPASGANCPRAPC